MDIEWKKIKRVVTGNASEQEKRFGRRRICGGRFLLRMPHRITKRVSR